MKKPHAHAASPKGSSLFWGLKNSIKQGGRIATNVATRLWNEIKLVKLKWKSECVLPSFLEHARIKPLPELDKYICSAPEIGDLVLPEPSGKWKYTEQALGNLLLSSKKDQWRKHKTEADNDSCS